jgi:regulator of sigma E protease
LDGVQSIQVQRDSQEINIPVNKEIIPKLIKDRYLIEPRIPYSLTVKGFAKDSPARDAGMEIGDKVLAINGHTFTYYDQFIDSLAASKGKEVNLDILRNGKEMKLPVKIGKAGMLGVARNPDNVFQFKTIKYSLLESIPAGVTRGYEAIGDYLKQFKLLFAPKTKAYESLGGFIAIGSIFPGMWDWQSFWNLTAFLSIILAVMNILPIPALDGGHVLFLLYEMVTRRKPSDKFLEYAQITGMVILFALLLFANGNDIIKLFK